MTINIELLLSAIFGSSFVTAIVVEVVRYVLSRRSTAKEKEAQRIEERVKNVSGFLDLFGELVGLYRFRARTSSTMIQDEEGDIVLDQDGKPVIEYSIFEPDPRIETAVKERTGVSLDSAIAHKIVEIALSSPRVQDLAQHLDPSGNLGEEIDTLYLHTVVGVDNIFQRHERYFRPQHAIVQIVNALDEADRLRREIGASVNGYLE